MHSVMFESANKNLLAVALLMGGAGAVTAGAPPDPMHPWIPSAVERAQLPQYCLKGDQGEIPNCGAFMNHFCAGLVYLMRARDFTMPREQRLPYVKRSRDAIDYTKRGMTAGCPIANDVATADTMLRVIESVSK